MQVFIPYKDVKDTTTSLFKDSRRFNKQIIECGQIINAIEGTSIYWRNHPVCKMYKNHLEWLKLYKLALENYKKNNSENFELYYSKANEISPNFPEEIYLNHRKRLYTKNPNAFEEFKTFGNSFVNLYYVDGKVLTYQNGHLIS